MVSYVLKTSVRTLEMFHFAFSVKENIKVFLTTKCSFQDTLLYLCTLQYFVYLSLSSCTDRVFHTKSPLPWLQGVAGMWARTETLCHLLIFSQ